MSGQFLFRIFYTSTIIVQINEMQYFVVTSSKTVTIVAKSEPIVILFNYCWKKSFSWDLLFRSNVSSGQTACVSLYLLINFVPN